MPEPALLDLLHVIWSLAAYAEVVAGPTSGAVELPR